MTTLYKVIGKFIYGDGAEKETARLTELLNTMGLVPHYNSVICNAEQALQLLSSDYCEKYEDVSKTVIPVSGAGTISKLEVLMSELLSKVNRLNEISFNEKCGTAQPNSALLDTAELLLLQDACTDLVQENLAKDWRILAIQPQSDQRRPDYILGRRAFAASRGN